MRIAVQPHAFELGGSQLNAVELARTVRERGHDVFVVCGNGPIDEMAADFGLPRLPMPDGVRRPSPVLVRTLRRWSTELRLDVIHGYEWPPAVEAWTACLGSRTASVATIYSMEVAPFLPRGADIVVGTHQIAARATSHRLGPLHVLEPPVDVRANRPGCGGSELRRRLGIADDEVVLVIVGRLTAALKLEGVLSAIDGAVALDRAGHRVRLVIVGDGKARADVDAVARAANRSRRAPLVHVVGEMSDPRSAYDAADVCLGMGGSALRALAFGKPLVVQGERGFWMTLTPSSHRVFAWSGWYGVGDGGSGADALVRELEPLIGNPSRRDELGRYGLRLVREEYGLDATADRLVGVYAAAASRAGRRPAELPRVIGGVLTHKVRRRRARRRGVSVAEDFNDVARLVAVAPPVGWRPPAWSVTSP